MALTAVAVSAGVWCVATPAFAHVGVDKDEIEAGASTSLSFSFSHGCGESPTNSMKFQIPEGIINAVPQVHAGWDIEVERAPLAEPAESAHGEEITDRPAVITYTARDGFEVPSGQKDTFTLSFTAPDEEGQLDFPIIQGCVEGSNDWIEAWDGTGTEPEHPAPSVMVVPGSGESSSEHGHDEAATETTVAMGDHDDEDDGSSNGLAIVGIVVGALGLAVGGVALARTRRSSRPVA
jgi:uncharacterized protein YcnI